MNDRLTILTGDCVEQLLSVADGTIDLTVCSPPYDGLRTYGGKSTWRFEELALLLFRVTKPGGVVCWNVGDSTIDGSETLTSFRQAIYFKDVAGFLVETMIYEKSNASKPNPRRYNQVFEYVFVLSKGQPATVNLIRDKANVTAGKSVFGKHTMREKDGSMTLRKNRIIAKEYGVRGNVWKGNTRGQEEVCKNLPHPAMMPKWLARDLILTWSNPDDLVLDPMCGSGTTLQAAIANSRRAVGIEVNLAYAEIARQRCDVTPGLGF